MQRRSPRLKDFDYGTPGAYFVTVVTRMRQALFGAINDEGVMVRSDLGTVAEAEWWRSATIFPGAKSPAFVLMPNHVHGIVCLNLDSDGGRKPARLTAFIGSFKSAVSRRIGRQVWQRSFYDRIIRDERDLEALWDYIESNPGRWIEDHENPACSGWAGQAPPLQRGKPRPYNAP